MTRDEAKAEIERLREHQEAIWREGLRKYLDMRSCDLGLCGKIDALVYSANTTPDPKRREKLEAEIKHLRDCRREAWNLVDREITQIEIAIAVLRRQAGEPSSP